MGHDRQLGGAVDFETRDGGFYRLRRPSLIVGGELLDVLRVRADVGYDRVTKDYDARFGVDLVVNY